MNDCPFSVRASSFLFRFLTLGWSSRFLVGFGEHTVRGNPLSQRQRVPIFLISGSKWNPLSLYRRAPRGTRFHFLAGSKVDPAPLSRRGSKWSPHPSGGHQYDTSRGVPGVPVRSDVPSRG